MYRRVCITSLEDLRDLMFEGVGYKESHGMERKVEWELIRLFCLRHRGFGGGWFPLLVFLLYRDVFLLCLLTF